jgi:hypothetical protein
LLSLSGCSVLPEKQQAAAPVHQPVYSTGVLTIHSQPEGAMIYVLDDVLWRPVGYSPVDLSVQLADGKLAKYYYLQAVPTGPGQLTQRWQMGDWTGSGSITVFMYNTGFGAAY